MKSQKSLVYVVESIDSAFSSQVVGLLCEIGKAEYFSSIHLIVAVAEGDRAVPESPFYTVHTFRRVPALPIISVLGALRLSRFIRLLRKKSDLIFHCRGESAAYLTMLACKFVGLTKPSMLLDVRGALRPEFSQIGSASRIRAWAKQWLLRLYADGYRKASAINYVSIFLKNYCDKEYGLVTAPQSVIPCCAGSDFLYSEVDRCNTRKELGVEKDEVLCLFATGGEAKWQNSDAVLDLVRQSNCMLLVLSKKKYDNAKVISRYVDYSEMPRYLCAADVGVMFREANVINYVACPIKIVEYLCTGLPLLSNDSVAVVRDFVVKDRCGALVASIGDVSKELLREIASADRTKLAVRYQAVFGVNAVAQQYINVYAGL